MVDRAALQIATVRDAHHHRAREGVAGAPPQSGQLVAELMVGGPDVVEELDLHHRLQAASREADGAAHDVRLGERGIVNPIAPELSLEPPRDLEDTALALDVLQMLLAAHVGHVLAEHHDARIPRHLVLQAGVEQVDHSGGIAPELRVVFRVELLGGGIDLGRVDVQQGRLRLRLGRSEEHTSELQSPLNISYAVFCLKKKNKKTQLTSTLLTQIRKSSHMI